MNDLDIFSLKRCAFQTIRPVVSRKKRGFSAQFRTGGAVLPPGFCPLQRQNTLEAIATPGTTVRSQRRGSPQNLLNSRTPQLHELHGFTILSPAGKKYVSYRLNEPQKNILQPVRQSKQRLLPAGTPGGLLNGLVLTDSLRLGIEASNMRPTLPHLKKGPRPVVTNP